MVVTFPGTPLASGQLPHCNCTLFQEVVPPWTTIPDKLLDRFFPLKRTGHDSSAGDESICCVPYSSRSTCIFTQRPPGRVSRQRKSHATYLSDCYEILDNTRHGAGPRYVQTTQILFASNGHLDSTTIVENGYNPAESMTDHPQALL